MSTEDVERHVDQLRKELFIVTDQLRYAKGQMMEYKIRFEREKKEKQALYRQRMIEASERSPSSLNPVIPIFDPSIPPLQPALRATGIFPYRYVPPHDFLPEVFVKEFFDVLEIVDKYAQLYHKHHVGGAGPRYDLANPTLDLDCAHSRIHFLEDRNRMIDAELQEKKEEMERLQQELGGARDEVAEVSAVLKKEADRRNEAVVEGETHQPKGQAWVTHAGKYSRQQPHSAIRQHVVLRSEDPWSSLMEEPPAGSSRQKSVPQQAHEPFSKKEAMHRVHHGYQRDGSSSEALEIQNNGNVWGPSMLPSQPFIQKANSISPSRKEEAVQKKAKSPAQMADYSHRLQLLQKEKSPEQNQTEAVKKNSPTAASSFSNAVREARSKGDWREVFDPKKQKIYFFNKLTRRTTWKVEETPFSPLPVDPPAAWEEVAEQKQVPSQHSSRPVSHPISGDETNIQRAEAIWQETLQRSSGASSLYSSAKPDVDEDEVEPGAITPPAALHRIVQVVPSSVQASATTVPKSPADPELQQILKGL